MCKGKAINSVTVWVLLILVTIAVLPGCSSESRKVEEDGGVNMDAIPDSQALVPLHVSVTNADDKWWFHDKFVFLGRTSTIGNIILAAEIDRCLSPDDDPKVVKGFRCRIFDGASWSTVGEYAEPDVINEMKTISVNPQIDFLWIEPNRSGTLRCFTRDGTVVVTDFMDFESYYSISLEGYLKRTYSIGRGRLEIGEYVWEGQMFHEMINVRGNNRCTGEMQDFNPQNLFTVFAQTAGGKTIVASVDINNAEDRVGKAFFTILDGGTYKVAYGSGRVTGRSADFRKLPGYDQLLPHYMEIFSGDSINVRLDMWVNRDRWDIVGMNSGRTGVFGNAVFWNRREKAWGVAEHSWNPQLDTLVQSGQ